MLSQLVVPLTVIQLKLVIILGPQTKKNAIHQINVVGMILGLRSGMEKMDQ